MKFVIVMGGSFEMGDQFGEGRDDEQNNRKITIKPFRLGAIEVTQAQWLAVMSSNPSKFKGDQRPVEQVSWNDIQQFIMKLNTRSGKGFRLPTEAEWEYACREGGRKVRYCHGQDEARKPEINFNSNKPKSVASFAPNSLGLYDMSGNVWEWTCSKYSPHYDGSEERCAKKATYYSLRGGSWNDGPSQVRASVRNSYVAANSRSYSIGFRLAHDIELSEKLSKPEADPSRRKELVALKQKQESAGVWTESNTGMKFRRVPSGSFLMGSPSSEEDGDNDETPHTVRVGEFWLGATEVTQAQWQAVMGSNPSGFKGDDLPVERVSWNDIQEFIKKLSARSGKGFRLPTEAEWEYACREGGRKVRYCNGKDKASRLEINYGGSMPKPVASFAPNSLGLYDMSGNVYEWTCSEYKRNYRGSDQKCAASDRRYSLRGGSWPLGPGWVRATARLYDYPDGRGDSIGFRLAQDIKLTEKEGEATRRTKEEQKRQLAEDLAEYYEQAYADCSWSRGGAAEAVCIKNRIENLKEIEEIKGN